MDFITHDVSVTPCRLSNPTLTCSGKTFPGNRDPGAPIVLHEVIKWVRTGEMEKQEPNESQCFSLIIK